MSPREETSILQRRLTGITWSVIITIATITCSVLYTGFKGYSNILSAIERNNSDYRQTQEQLRSIGNDVNRHEQQLQFLIMRKKR